MRPTPSVRVVVGVVRPLAAVPLRLVRLVDGRLTQLGQQRGRGRRARGAQTRRTWRFFISDSILYGSLCSRCCRCVRWTHLPSRELRSFLRMAIVLLLLLCHDRCKESYGEHIMSQ